MKKNLLLFMILVVAGIVKSHAQNACTVSNLTIDIKEVTSGLPGDSCQINLDMSFTGNFNNGNKYVFIHLWEVSNPASPVLDNSKAPTPQQLANAVATIVIENPYEANPTVLTQYIPYPGVAVKSASVVKSGTTFTLSNIELKVSTCEEAVPVTGALWASQGTNASKPHCFNSEAMEIIFNNTIVSGVKKCTTPSRLIDFKIENAHILNESVVVSAFIDVAMNGVVDPGTDINITSNLTKNSSLLGNPISIPANSDTLFTNWSYLPYSNDPAYDTKPILIQVNATTVGFDAVVVYTQSLNFLGECAQLSTLPVTFTSFTAKRDESNVVLQWETSSEQNNTGFAVERNINGAWVGVTFVPSQAAGGNSSSRLVYKYEDLNAVKGVSQYRLKQVDIDGQFKYSQVRSVSGEEQAGKVIVYPNPSGNGKVSVVFEEINGKHDISLMDITGRVLKQWKAVYNNVQIDNLASGVYHLRIISRETGKQTVEKIVVSRQ